MTVSELSSALAARGLIAAEPLHIVPLEAHASPWYVQVMIGVSAWFAGLLLLLFVVIGFESVIFRHHEDWSVVLVTGMVACAGAAVVYIAAGEKSAFGSQFALAISLAGQSAMVISIGEMWRPRAAIWAMLVIEIALVLVMRNRLHRILSSLAAVIAWALGTHEILFHELPGISWNTSQPGQFQTSVVSILLWFLVWAPVAYGAYCLVAGEARWMADGRETLLRPVTHGLIAALAIAPMATHPASFWMAMGMGSAFLLSDGSLNATALWPLLSIGLALLSLALAFNLRNRPLMGLAIVCSLLEISAFYYVLGTTLLVKSILMLLLGAALLASAHVLAKESK
jgi:uncharacterized membrane protein